MGFNSRLLNLIHLENCGGNDESLAHIVEGAESQAEVLSVTLKQQEVGSRAVAALGTLLARPFPQHLLELRLIHCKIGARPFVALCEYLQSSLLQKLALVKVNLGHESIGALCSFIATSSYLTHLDVAWNELAFHQYRPLLDALGASRDMQEINLSHNQLMNHTCSEEFVVELTEKLKFIVQSNQALVHLYLNQCGLCFEILELLMKCF